MSLRDVKRSILAGEYDDGLHEIQSVIKMRQKYVGETRRMELSVGDSVEFLENVRPAQLQGQRGEIVGFPGSVVRVRVDAGGSDEGSEVEVHAYMLGDVDS
jgi:hypothetical protein